MFYKTFYKGGSDVGGVSAVSADTKLRRETSNFKINFIPGTYIPDPNSKNPTEPIKGLVQILPKNLSPEDFVGLIWHSTAAGCLVIVAQDKIVCHNDSWDIGDVFYHPSTGYLVDDQYLVADVPLA